MDTAIPLFYFGPEPGSAGKWSTVKIKSTVSIGLFEKPARDESRPTPRDFLLEAMPKASVCAEIGVHHGDFSRRILEVIHPKKLHLIDPWQYLEDEVYKSSNYGGERGGNQAIMDQRYRNVVKRFRLEIVRGQVVIHRDYSHKVCDLFEDHYFDWIYIDGNHLYEFVTRDLALYFDKVKRGGFIAGDDYVEGGWWHGGVKKAVDEFIASGRVRAVYLEDRQFCLHKG